MSIRLRLDGRLICFRQCRVYVLQRQTYTRHCRIYTRRCRKQITLTQKSKHTTRKTTLPPISFRKRLK
ncbi:hypothetical protein B5F96_12340 [Parabacteroides johnsonii]|uniref:Uncharacterized protein n=1 Tax=Parabacteroides johnsonii TaxID=387661 RepID=A0A9Q5SQ95_9BACT|nr:hypothetical protein B5F96_12340 [Parabacteroides johnsonii]